MFPFLCDTQEGNKIFPPIFIGSKDDSDFHYQQTHIFQDILVSFPDLFPLYRENLNYHLLLRLLILEYPENVSPVQIDWHQIGHSCLIWY